MAICHRSHFTAFGVVIDFFNILGYTSHIDTFRFILRVGEVLAATRAFYFIGRLSFDLAVIITLH